jgi:6-phosphogluconolactonase (cycloisomerase 2 family)
MIFVQTNDADGNAVVAFRREADGRLTRLGETSTGGRGNGLPHLPSQGSLTIAGNHLLAVNAGSGELSVLAIGGESLTLTDRAATGGMPVSVTHHSGSVRVLNGGAEPSIAGFTLAGGRLTTSTSRALAAGSDPAQVAFTPDGRQLVVTERGTNAIALYPVDGAGRLGEPLVQPSSGPTPYGFAFTRGGTLVVTEAFGAEVGRAAASSYVVDGGSITPVSRSVGNGRSEICWAVISNDDRYAFTTNFADGAVSRYAVADDGTLTLEDATAGIAVDGQTGLRDEGLSSNGRFLYAIDADSRRVFGWAVDPNGSLSPIGAWDGLPATVAGLAAS